MKGWLLAPHEHRRLSTPGVILGSSFLRRDPALFRESCCIVAYREVLICACHAGIAYRYFKLLMLPVSFPTHVFGVRFFVLRVSNRLK